MKKTSRNNGIDLVYEDIFSADTNRLLAVALYLKQLTQIRVDLEDEVTNDESNI